MLLLPERAVTAIVAAGARANLPPPTRSAGEIARAAQNVLSRAEYHRHDPNVIQRAQRAIADFIGRLLTDALSGTNIIGLILFSALVLLVVFVSVRVGRGVTPGGGVPIVGGAIARRSAADWRSEAAARERDGDWRGALRCRYRALVADLAERGLVDEIPGRTAGEYRREVAGSLPDAAVEFAGATELFELAWYGHRSTGADEAARFDDLAGRVLAGAGR